MKEGTTIWLLGLSASGKSTLAKKLTDYLNKNNKKTQLIDGDVLREDMGGMFGYTREERIKVSNIYRAMAKLLNRNGINVVVAAITPYEEVREKNRKTIGKYIEINLNCPVDECIKRDPKGLYERALTGQEKHVIGIDEEYESPQNSDIEIRTDIQSIEQSFEIIVKFLESMDI